MKDLMSGGKAGIIKKRLSVPVYFPFSFRVAFMLMHLNLDAEEQ